MMQAGFEGWAGTGGLVYGAAVLAPWNLIEILRVSANKNENAEETAFFPRLSARSSSAVRGETSLVP